MNRKTCAAAIGCTMEEELLEQLSSKSAEHYHWKKVLPPDGAALSKRYQDVPEVVSCVDAIVEDDDITVVFVSRKYLGEASRLISAGKSVRVV